MGAAPVDWSKEPGLAARAAASAAPGFADLDRAPVLESIAAALDARRDEIVRVAAADSALTQDELAPEFARMVGTFRLFADVLRDGAWAQPAVNPRADATIGPNHDVRRMLVPLGPVAVFGASNFPLAYGVCGGDMASALAAGCPVVVKEHPAHVKTGRLLAAIAREALAAAGASPDALGSVANEDPKDLMPANSLVSHPAIAAVGFTGSIRGGLAIEAAARKRPVPIPVFAEMGSTNPVFVTANALAARSSHIAQVLADSILARFGQQCTCPGIIAVPESAKDARTFTSLLAGRIAQAQPRDMLAAWVRDAYEQQLEQVRSVPGVKVIVEGARREGARAGHTCLFSTDLKTFSEHAVLREEIFGPGAIVVSVPDETAFAAMPLAGSLTASLFFEEDNAHDRGLAAALLKTTLVRLAGRVIANGVPTGVRVAAGMVHGGPFPSSNRPDTTAVGPYALSRWCRPVCWQNWPGTLLPRAVRG